MNNELMKKIARWVYPAKEQSHSIFTPVTDISRLPGMEGDRAQRIAEVVRNFSFKANDYYLGLADWSDPDDPIRAIAEPRQEEMDHWGAYDASDEASNIQVHGLQHKYSDSVLFLITDNCAGYCRYCFRKRIFLEDADDVPTDYSQAYAYIAEHPEITDVILSGGDPLTLSARRIAGVLDQLARIPHVQVVRIGSKTPAYNPTRLGGDPDLQEVFRKFSSTSGKGLYLMAHFDHPRELTPLALKELRLYRDCGMVLLNQAPILRGVNDNPDTLRELFQILCRNGCAPYYMFQGRPVKGNRRFCIPITEAFQIFQQAIGGVSGISKRVRFVMSHSTGKIEIVGLDRQYIYTRYRRAKSAMNQERFMVFHRDDQAYWLEDLEPVEPPRKSIIHRMKKLVSRSF
ncbi:MAG: KamA family radical SAM protein [Nitrospinota bacterium]|nr:KamA family radical SAM protein [Nitrospinota bacterium]